MTPAGEILAAAIRRSGPIPFRRFMETALYHPEHGYYRTPRDPFGKQGDFYTAEQIQPVFGILIAARIRQLWREMGEPAGFTVVELGAGRAEMTEALSQWPYIPVDVGQVANPRRDCPSPQTRHFPGRIQGVIFSNEFFDALPVEAAVYQNGVFHQQLVALRDDRFEWRNGGPVSPEVDDYLRRFYPPPEEGRWYEANLDAVAWMDRVALTLEGGFLLTIDYGFTRAESIRFPQGTLMGYRRHTARENVLEDPGVRDITAHVNFTALQELGTGRGLRTVRFESLAQTLLAAGEPDQFAAALAGDDLRRRMQLKTLLFGMGETFRVLLQRKE